MSRPDRRRSRAGRLAGAVALLLAIVAATALNERADAEAPASAAPVTIDGPLPARPAVAVRDRTGIAVSGTSLGVVGATGRHLAEEAAAGLHFVTLAASWATAEPSPGAFNQAYAQELLRRIDDARSQGLAVVLDPGIQYTPAWVFALPGGTRFVNQYGDLYQGSADSGRNIANAVTNPAVRGALGTYVQWLGQVMAPAKLLGVRVGGGALGELRYPDTVYQGHTNSWWAYDSDTQARSPVPGWIPGTGTAEQARAFLDVYNGALVDYGVWLDGAFAAAFPGADRVLLLPGWGERPGGDVDVVASLLTLQRDEFNQGLDWRSLVPQLPDPAHVVLYTTYLDAPAASTSATNPDPATYLVGLGRPRGFRVGGENTGRGTPGSLALVMARARALGLVLVGWMSEDDLVASSAGARPGLASFADLASAGRTA